MIVKYLGNDAFEVNSRGVTIGINANVGEMSVGLKDGDYHFCPKGNRCKQPWEGWLDWKHLSILVVPAGVVIVDDKTSIGLWQVPPSVHVDMIVGTESPEEDVPFQDISLLQEGDLIEPFNAVVYPNETIHKMKLESRWFELIMKSEKVIEGRVLDEKRKKIRVGHLIEFKDVNSERRLYCKVRRISIYNNFREMLEREGTERVLPGMSVDEGEKVYQKYYGLDAGPVLALRIELL